jgi:ribosomal protein L37AE/L43A
MANTMNAYCKNCHRTTMILFDGEDWECDACGDFNPFKTDYVENPYDNDWIKTITVSFYLHLI